MICELNSPYQDFNGAWVFGNMHERNPQFTIIQDWQKERVKLLGTGKVEEFEMNLMKNRPRYTFCDGYMHYKSYGSDPCYMVIGFCPDQINKEMDKNPDFKRGRL